MRLLHRTRAHRNGSRRPTTLHHTAEFSAASAILSGLLRYEEIAPPPLLAPYVRCLWTLHGAAPPKPERIVPDGAFELVFHRGAPFVSRGTPQPRAMLMGEVRRHVVIEPPHAVDVLGVRFHVGGASAFFDFPMIDARDHLVALDVVPETTTSADVFRFLADRLRVPRHAGIARAAVARINAARGDIRVGSLAQSLGATERTLQRAFDEVVGLTPKQLCRVVRFQAAVRDEDTLAFYDQSHQIHEFRELAGVTPTDYWREQNAINDAFVGNLQS